MKTKFILMTLLFCSCSNSNFQGHFYDYDTEKPLKDVYIKINDCLTLTDSAGYFAMKMKSNSTIETICVKKAI